MLYVADTHTLVWVLTNQTRRLGSRARKAFEAADRGQVVVHLSVVTLLELDWLEQAGKLAIKESLEELVRNLSVVPGYNLVALTAEIILRSRKFRAFDSMDRLIVATAEEMDCPLITADAAIQERNPVPIVWD
ncbi:type II toxin-antitoxin system VapC family toxin [Acidobacteriia bacterium AH_259_A11_L15]|nr:type II toxin-antitoxin system VapC family toxin [Acidobacteriia bacterium AH_259_A11_L15]